MLQLCGGKKRTGFGPHPGKRKPKPDATEMQVAHGGFSLAVGADASSIQMDEWKSGQVLVRTRRGEHLGQMRLECRLRTAISCRGRGDARSVSGELSKKRTGFGSHRTHHPDDLGRFRGGMSGDLNLQKTLDAKTGENGKMPRNWNVSGTRDFSDSSSQIWVTIANRTLCTPHMRRALVEDGDPMLMFILQCFELPCDPICC
jgi:hypothetical protein